MTEEVLLAWLGDEESSYFGECKCPALDALVEKGLAEIGHTPLGRSRDYARVRLTEKGLAALAALSAQ